MTEQSLVSLFRNTRRYETELRILQDCTDGIYDAGDAAEIQRFALIKRKLALIGHLLHMLPFEERRVLQKNLVEGYSWKRIADEEAGSRSDGLSCDVRALQRMQARALKSLREFIQSAFGDNLDYLIDDTAEKT